MKLAVMNDPSYVVKDWNIIALTKKLMILYNMRFI